jgi:nicotinate-nucleotide adenylyltransferase
VTRNFGRRKEVGLFGGTFDPPTTAHLEIAMRSRSALDLDAVWLVPSMGSHKSPVAPPAQRLAMCELMVVGHAGLCVSSVDFEDGGRCYSVDTLIALTNRHPDTDFTFLVGDDIDVTAWHQWDRCQQLATFVRVERAGSKHRYGDIRRIQLGFFPHSSTQSRALLASGSVDSHLTASVARYIDESGLYGPLVGK